MYPNCQRAPVPSPKGPGLLTLTASPLLETSIEMHYNEVPELKVVRGYMEGSRHRITNSQVVFHFDKGDQGMSRIQVFSERISTARLLDDIVGLIGKEFLQELLQGLLMGMLECDSPADGAAAKATVTRNYKGEGRYRRRFFARNARTARQVARRNGSPISHESSLRVAFVTLEEIRNGKDQEMSLMIQEGNRMYPVRAMDLSNRRVEQDSRRA